MNLSNGSIFCKVHLIIGFGVTILEVHTEFEVGIYVGLTKKKSKCYKVIHVLFVAL